MHVLMLNICRCAHAHIMCGNAFTHGCSKCQHEVLAHTHVHMLMQRYTHVTRTRTHHSKFGSSPDGHMDLRLQALFVQEGAVCTASVI